MTLSLCVSMSHLCVTTVSIMSRCHVSLCHLSYVTTVSLRLLCHVSLCHIYVSRLCLSCHGVMYLCVTSLMSRLCLLCHGVTCIYVTSLYVTIVCLMSRYVCLCHVSLCLDRVSLGHERCAAAHISFRLGTHNTQLLCSECLGSFHGSGLHGPLLAHV